MWQQSYLLFGMGTLGSSLIAAIPIVTMLVLLGLSKRPAWVASLSGLFITFCVAILAYRMPVSLAVAAASNGAAFGIFPICWVIFWAIVLFRITVDTGNFEVIKDSVELLAPDPRLQALLVAFAFGGFLEGAAGFGTPVAIAASMLIGLGFSPTAHLRFASSLILRPLHLGPLVSRWSRWLGQRVFLSASYPL
jgi:lactate permease